MIRVAEGNIIQMLLNNQIDILIHGCNCQSTLPIGLGQEIELTFPEVGTAHWKHYVTRRRSSEGMIGEFSEYFYKRDGRKFGVINLYSQVWPGPDLRESKMKSGLINIFKKYGAKKKSGLPIRYGLPVIGENFGLMTLDLFKTHLINIELKLDSNLDIIIVV